MKYKGLSQIAFRVQDIERSLDFYCKTLGFEHLFCFYQQNGEPFMYYLRAASYQYVELIPDKSARPCEDASFHHLCLIVEDVHAAAKELQGKGLSLYHGPAAFGNVCSGPEEIRPGMDNSPSFYIIDPDGNNIEIMQFVSESVQHQYEKKE
jgi:lactoylglutathione lyase